MAARTVRARGGGRIGQDLRDGGPRRLPGARGPRPDRGCRPRRGRPAGQRALPHLHEQGHGEPAAPRPPRARRARAPRRGGTGDPELPRVRGVDPRAVRGARGLRAGRARADAGAAQRAVRARARRDDVRARLRDLAAVAGLEDPGAGRAGAEPPGHATGDRSARRGTARAVEERPVEPGVHGGAGTAGAGARRRPLPGAEARARRARLRRSDRPRDRGRCAPSRDRRRPPRAVPSRLAGRVPGHERRAGRADVDAVRRRATR